MDYFDLKNNCPLAKSFSHIKNVKFLVIAFSSDWLYPPYQSKDIVKALKINGLDVTYCEISSDYGHDAFLLEFDEESRLISNFLTRVKKNSEDLG